MKNLRLDTFLDVVASISAISAEDLDAKGLGELADIQFFVPSLHFGGNFGSNQMSIRGVGAFDRNPGVGISVDGVYQARTGESQLFQLDLERVEVLRGPQGTLYGRNSNGGVVNFITKSPTREAEGMIRVGYAEFDEKRVQAVFNAPINDRVAFRIAADHTDRGEGWIENLSAGKDDLMQGEYSNVRLKLAAELTDKLSVELMYAKGRKRGILDQQLRVTDNRELTAMSIPGLDDATLTLEPLKVYMDTPGQTEIDYDIYSLTFEWDLRWATLKSITAKQHYLEDKYWDLDSTDSILFITNDLRDNDTFTQEFNLLGSNDTFEWVLGAFYSGVDLEANTFHDLAPNINFAPFPAQLDFDEPHHETDSLAFFADGTWHVTDRVRVSAGARRTEDELDEYHRNSYLGLIPAPVELAVFCALAVKDEWSETTIRAVAQYDLTDTRNVYVSYSEGYKAGNVARYECVPAYSPEFVDAYEVGYKAVFNGGRTNLSLALFHYDYSDFQLNQTIGIAVVTRNAGDTLVQGAELQLSSLLNENWSVSAAVTLLDTE